MSNQIFYGKSKFNMIAYKKINIILTIIKKKLFQCQLLVPYKI